MEESIGLTGLENMQKRSKHSKLWAGSWNMVVLYVEAWQAQSPITERPSQGSTASAEAPVQSPPPFFVGIITKGLSVSNGALKDLFLLYHHHPTATDPFADEGMVHAIKQVNNDFARGLLGQISIMIWASQGGKSPPSAFQLGALFSTAHAWEEAVKGAWDDCALGET